MCKNVIYLYKNFIKNKNKKNKIILIKNIY